MIRVKFISILIILIFGSFKSQHELLEDTFHFMAPNSPLADGDIYRLSTDRAGVFKLDYNFIKNELGVDLDTKDPRNIQFFSFGGGMLDELIFSQQPESLKEVSVFIDGEQDGKFDPKDFILFYSQGPDHREWSENDGMVTVKKNLYSRTAQYLIKFSTTPGVRIQTIPSPAIIPRDTFSQYLEVQHMEDEKTNLLSGRIVTYGSGKQWYGDNFKVTRKKDYSFAFRFQNLMPQSLASFKVGFAGRANQYTEVFLLNNAVKNKIQLNPTNTGDVEDDVARESSGVFHVPVERATSVVIDYPLNSFPSEGWLNYITLNTWHKLNWSATPMTIFNPRTLGKPATYALTQVPAGLEVWNVSESLHPTGIQRKIENGTLFFVRPATPEVETFIAFDKAGSISTPTKGPKISNQNLSSITGYESVILYSSKFDATAQKLAAHRLHFSNIKTLPILIDQVYLEFGAGQPDPTTIRNFARTLFLNNPEFKYLTLLGDGSYDYLNHNKAIKNENLIPVFETDESLSPIFAFPSDDYYGLLEVGDGGPDLLGDLDIAIGRIPVRSPEEADAIIQKIINYDLTVADQSDWKIRVAFSADDEDGNVHLDQSEEIATGIENNHPELNIQKIYLDAFKQESGAAGEIIPGASQSLFKNVFQGLLVFNYLGHGGPKGLSSEGFLRTSDVESWSNKSKLPLVITATCSFAPYDDPAVNSIGEELFRSTYGGAIALFTTVRNVYSSSNKILTLAVFNHIFTKDQQRRPLTLGEIMRRAKNSISSNSSDQLNARKFALIGDPSQRLSIPNLGVKTTHINSKPVAVSRQDTIRSLELLTIQGRIVGVKDQNLIQTFNGNISITLFDKKSTSKTLGQNTDSYPRAFQVQNSVLFKGNAVVKNGVFKIEFVIPKDIDYNFGSSKISYFASSLDSLEAAGVYEQLIVGGSQQLISDNDAPKLNLHINHLLFKDGDETHPDPLLLVNLFDENGINGSGNSIGHDLVAILDGNKQFVLNSFYQAVQGNYKKGNVAFPFSNLSPGLHRIKVRAWDVANNSGEAEISFVVLNSKSPSHILSISAFPNPTKNQVEVQVVHNLDNLKDAKIKYSLTNLAGQKIAAFEDFLSPAAVTTRKVNFPSGTPMGIYIILTEIWNDGKRIDSRGIKVLRIP